MIVHALLVGVALLVAGSAWSQVTDAPQDGPAIANRPPALLAEWQESTEPLSLRSVEVEVRVFGPLAETRMTLTFFNPHPRALEGDLYFPLPEGATVSGYALDVEGRMVEGVVVDRHQARRVLEIEERKGVDPGVLEWAKGNNFRTRVFPIPAQGTRTVRVDYVSRLTESSDDPIYQLPLRFSDRIPSVSIRVEVVQTIEQPVVVDGAGMDDLAFTNWRDSFVAEAALSDAELIGNLRIALPSLLTRRAWVERGRDDRFYFLIRDPVARAPDRSPVDPVGRIRLLWDQSGSRSGANLEREIALLARFLSTPVARKAVIELVRFSDRAERAIRYSMPHQRGALISALRDVRYDGGTRIDAIDTGEETGQPDLYLVFTDGVLNFGERLPKRMNAPVYIVNSSATADHPFLRHLASSTGGAYLNLRELSDDRVLAEIGRPGARFVSTRADPEAASEMRPSAPGRVHGPLMLAGVLMGESARIALEYERGDGASERRDFEVRRADAVPGDFISRYWAGRKIDELLAFPRRNERQIGELGKRHSIVTPGTSLIVLERLDQYVEHRIRPPASLAEMRVAYDDAIAEIEQEKVGQPGKLERVLALWEQRVAWWQKEFDYLEGFRYEPPKSHVSAPLPAGDVEEILVQGESGRLEMAERASVTAFASEDLNALGVESVGDLATFTPNLEIRDESSAAEISLRAWDPETPYLAALESAAREHWLEVYFEHRATYGRSAGFFLDCADFFHRSGEEARAVRVLGNLAELELENPALLRILAHRLAQWGELDLAAMVFEEVLALRPEEPQSLRDLALVLARRADRSSDAAARLDYERALDLLAQVVMSDWDRFDEIEVIALTELNAIWTQAKRRGVERVPLDDRLVRALAVDVRIVMTWDTDMTDMDLHVVEPSGERAHYSHNRTTIGGLVSRDFTDGYGPEVYILRRAMPGAYKIEADYFGSSSARVIGAVTLQVDVFTNFGRPGQQRESLTFRLDGRRDRVTVGEVQF